MKKVEYTPLPAAAQYGKIEAVTTLCRFRCGVAWRGYAFYTTDKRSSIIGCCRLLCAKTVGATLGEVLPAYIVTLDYCALYKYSYLLTYLPVID